MMAALVSEYCAICLVQHSYERPYMTYRYYENDSVVVNCSLCIGHQVVEEDDSMDAFLIYVQMQIHNATLYRSKVATIA